MRTLTRNFVQGLLVIAPLAITIWIVWLVLQALERWIDRPSFFVGLTIAIAAITLVGYLTGSVVARRVGTFVDRILRRVPFIRLLYNSFRDLLGAFVGDRKGFQKPVFVEVNPNVKVFGFMTCEQFDDPQLSKHVSVYLPQSYNFAGNMIVVPRSQVHPLDAEGSGFMAFILSGGVTAMSASKTVADLPRSELS